MVEECRMESAVRRLAFDGTGIKIRFISNMKFEYHGRASMLLKRVHRNFSCCLAVSLRVMI